MSTRGRAGAAAAVLALAILPPASSASAAAAASLSIVARDAATGDLGVAAASHAPASGSAIPWARAGEGAMAVQAWTIRGLGERGLGLLRDGIDPRSALARLLAEDGGSERRQLALMNARGACATHTGRDVLSHAGAIEAPNLCVQGNFLPGPAALEALRGSFLETEGKGMPLPERLVRALERGATAGGDVPGLRSAALLCVSGSGDPARTADLRVDDAAAPVAELRRLLDRVRGRLGHRTLSRPAGADVRELQALLRRAGLLDREPTGVFDDATAAAVEAFRRAQGLAARGRADEAVVDEALVALLRAAALEEKR
ncbi:MAG TPA: DUF1028 domain-containing protein [Candidatus Polarisedimenticolia bacterium]|nr:DUF1028 domain-containing protein [Candidatus Polarisedimenticolia bacterium]